MTRACGICGAEAEVMATVPMCGKRPRYPLCHGCLSDLDYSAYAEDIVPLTFTSPSPTGPLGGRAGLR